MTAWLEVRAGEYHDSVTLMVVSGSVAEVDGVDAALVAMATELNLGLLGDLGFDAEEAAGAGPNDLVVAITATGDAALERARATVETALTGAASRGGGATGVTSGSAPPRTTGAAARRAPHDLALISVPGAHAFVEAMDALRAGLHVMVFSDNLPLEQEVALKAEGARRGRLVMGPDCGTAIVGGVGLGFANVVRPGPVGIVAASGTGAQQLCCLLDAADVGVRAVLGAGGRDLSAEVGAASTLTALAALEDDPGSEVIVLVSKPPDPAVAARVRDAAAACATPTVVAFVGRGEPDLTAVAAQVQRALGREPVEPRWWLAPYERGPHDRLVGLFAGGTLCDEAMAIAAATLGAVASNIPLDPSWPRVRDVTVAGDVLLDLGEDRFTAGRPHPMIDQRARLAAIADVAALPGRAVLLIDVVLGAGAHPDPAAELAPAIADAQARAHAAGGRIAAVVSLCGTRDDPQDRQRQADALVEAGASVHLSNAAAARKAVELIAR